MILMTTRITYKFYREIYILVTFYETLSIYFNTVFINEYDNVENVCLF